MPSPSLLPIAHLHDPLSAYPSPGPAAPVLAKAWRHAVHLDQFIALLLAHWPPGVEAIGYQMNKSHQTNRWRVELACRWSDESTAPAKASRTQQEYAASLARFAANEVLYLYPLSSAASPLLSSQAWVPPRLTPEAPCARALDAFLAPLTTSELLYVYPMSPENKLPRTAQEWACFPGQRRPPRVLAWLAQCRLDAALQPAVKTASHARL